MRPARRSKRYVITKASGCLKRRRERPATIAPIRREDEKAVRAVMLKANKEQSAGTSCDDAQIVAGRDIDLPKTVIHELSQARARAIRSQLAQRPETALAVTVAAMVL